MQRGIARGGCGGLRREDQRRGTSMLVRVIDLETTGVEPTDKVVEIAAWDLADDQVCHGWSSFINPGIPIPPGLSAIHHIIDSDVASAGAWPDAAMRIIAPDFREVDEQEVDAFAAHNAKFERQWVTDDLTGGKPWICTYRCALRVWPEAPGHGNQELRYWLKHDCDRSIAREAHRAGPDAYVTAFHLRELLKRATFDDLVKWSGEPALLPRVTFGKHRGAAWNDVPRDYLEWILRQADMNEDVKFTARQTLEAGRK